MGELLIPTKGSTKEHALACARQKPRNLEVLARLTDRRHDYKKYILAELS
jgi:hypothetical protein